MIPSRRVLLLSIVAFLSACGGAEKRAEVSAASEDPDSYLGAFVSRQDREMAAESDSRERYAHGGTHNFNPGTARGTSVIDTNDKAKFQRDLGTKKFTPAKAVSENYEYETNREDVIARHTFVLAGVDRTLGHHVAFFESRHQHHALVRLEFDFVGKGVAGVKAADLEAGRKRFEADFLKNKPLPAGQFYSVQVSPLNPEFELVTIPTGVTRTFLGSLSVIDVKNGSRVTRFNDKGADVVVKVAGVYHFSRMYTAESPSDLQYLGFSARDAADPSRVVLAHVIQGSLASPPPNALNVEHMVEAKIVAPADFRLKDESIIEFSADTRPTYALLRPQTDREPGEEVEGVVVRDGGQDVVNKGAAQKVTLRITKLLYDRPIGKDAGQDAVRRKVRGE